MNLSKNGNVEVTNQVVENGCMQGSELKLVSYNNGSITGPTDGQYTIKSPIVPSSWGCGFYIAEYRVMVPYGYIYRVEMEIYVPTAHDIQIDVNNSVQSGYSAWNGNDNDNAGLRTPVYFSIPAKTWTKLRWGSSNTSEKNTNHVDIYVYDGIGLVTSSDTESPTTWYMRNPKVYVGTNERTLFGFNREDIYSNSIIET